MNVCACGAPPPAPKGSSAADRKTAQPTTLFDHVHVADDAVRKLRGYGIPLDFSPASLLALDSFLDSTVGDEGYAPHEEEWAPDDAQNTLILLYGSYLGEVVRRRVGGAWQDEPGSTELSMHIVLPAGEQFFPFARLWKRLRSGNAYSLLRAFDELVASLPAGQDAPNEAPQWVAMGDVFLGAGQPRVAERFYERARSVDPRLPRAAEASTRVRASTMPGPLPRGAAAPPSDPPPRGDVAADHSIPRASEMPTPREGAPRDPLPPTPRETPHPPAAVARAVTEEAFPAAARARAWAPRPPSAPPPGSLLPGERPATIPPTGRSPSAPIPAAGPQSAPPPARLPSPPPGRAPSAPPPGRSPTTPPGGVPLGMSLPDAAPARGPSSPPPRLTSDAPPAAASSFSLPSMPFEVAIEPHEAPRPVAMSVPPTSQVLGARRGASVADVASDLCALALGADISAIDEALLANSDLIGSPLIAELSVWMEQTSRDRDPRSREEGCDAVSLIAERFGVAHRFPEKAALLERCARVLGTTLSASRRAEVLRQMALAQIEGEGPRRLEDAITVLDAAVRQLDPKANAEAWASLHRTLADVHLQRTGAARKDAVDAAIGALQQVVRARSKKDEPEAWAAAQLALGQALRLRLSGERQRNVDDAMAAFRGAIEAAAPKAETWSLAKQGLGLCLLASMEGDRGKNGEEAIARLEESLTAFEPASAAASRSHYHLGLAYQRRKLGARAENLEKAAEHYRASMAGLDAAGTGERQSLTENLEAAEREIKKLRA